MEGSATVMMTGEVSPVMAVQASKSTSREYSILVIAEPPS